jgi:signal transduction histidine kinase
MKLRLPSGLGWRVAVFAAAILAVVVGLLAFLGLRSVDEQTDRLLQQRLVIAQLVAGHIDETVSHSVDELEVRAVQLSKEGYDPSQAGRELPTVLEVQEEFSHIVVLDQYGRVVAADEHCPATLGDSLANHPCLQSARTGSGVTAVYGTLPFEEGPGVCLAAPVEGPEGATVGYLVGLTHPIDLSSAISLAVGGLGERAHLELVDDTGAVIRSSINEPLGYTNEHSAYFTELISARETDVSTCHNCHTESAEPRKDVIAFAPTESIPWGVVLREPEHDVLGPADSLRQQVLIVGGLSVLLIVLLAWALVRFITRPVGRLIAASGRIAGGDLDTPVPAVGQDEIGALARRLDEMRVQLGTSRQRMERWNVELEQIVQQRTSELATLLDISTTSQAAKDLERLLETILARSVASFEAADAAALFLHDPDDDRLVARASIGYDQGPLSRVRLQPGEAIVGKAFRWGRGILCTTPEEIAANIADLRKENEDYFEGARSGVRQPRSAMCAPLIAKDSVLGAIILVNLRGPGAFSDSDLRFLQTVANHIAVVLENARLLADASRALALEEANQFKDEFLANISHQLLTPVTATKAAADLLAAANEGEAETTARLVESISRNTQRLQALVEELLDLARLHRGEASLSRRSWDLREIVEDSVASIEPLAEEKELALGVQTPVSSCPVLADRGRLEQALLNLLSNSQKFTPRGGRIEVALSDRDGEYLVSVTDTGPGIPAAEQSDVFERFYSRSRGPGQKAGVGLGLTIAKTVVELHGGRVWVESRGGRGSAFFIVLLKEDGGEDTGRR